jgi:signal recognition particle subunit SEC65
MFYLVGSKSKNPIYDLIIGLYLNSTLSRFFLEINGLVMMGDSTLAIYMVRDLQESLIVNPEIFIENGLQSKFELIIESFAKREILDYFEELGFQKCTQRNCNHPEHPYEYIKPEEVSFDRIMPDRRELDKIVFEVLGLTEEEQLEVYRAVLELVKNRLLKAKSR